LLIHIVSHRFIMNDVITVAEKLYYEANPNTKMDVPSFAYEKVEAANRRRNAAQSDLSLYEWCKQELASNGG
jgi:capsule polysaccharide export protein KpsE/RkpR